MVLERCEYEYSVATKERESFFFFFENETRAEVWKTNTNKSGETWMESIPGKGKSMSNILQEYDILGELNKASEAEVSNFCRWGEVATESQRGLFSHVHLCMLSQIQPIVIPWTIAHQAPLSMGFSRQEYWSGLLFPLPGNLSDPGIYPASPEFPALQVDSLPLRHLGSLCNL